MTRFGILITSILLVLTVYSVFLQCSQADLMYDSYPNTLFSRDNADILLSQYSAFIILGNFLIVKYDTSLSSVF